MCAADLQLLYRVLREELDAAYAEQPWDAARIDCIAQDLLRLERCIALHGVAVDAVPPAAELAPAAAHAAADGRDQGARYSRSA